MERSEVIGGVTILQTTEAVKTLRGVPFWRKSVAGNVPLRGVTAVWPFFASWLS